MSNILQQSQNYYAILSATNFDLLVRIPLPGNVLALKKNTRTPRVHLVYRSYSISDYSLIFMVTIVISLLCIVYLLYYVNKLQEEKSALKV